MRKIIFLLLFLTACSEKIASELDQSKTNQILVALAKYGIEASKIKESKGWSIEVYRKDSARAMEILSLGRYLNVAQQNETSSSFVQSKSEMQHLLERKLANSLSETLERMPYVREARVHIGTAEIPEFSKEIPERTASVLIVLEPETEFETLKVQKLVSGAAGIKQEQVSVVFAYAQEPAKYQEVSKYSPRLKESFLILIPALFISLILVRRFNSCDKKINKILKNE